VEWGGPYTEGAAAALHDAAVAAIADLAARN
jgi:hypothetical protein